MSARWTDGEYDPYPWLDPKPPTVSETFRGIVVGLALSCIFWAVIIGAAVVGQR